MDWISNKLLSSGVKSSEELIVIVGDCISLSVEIPLVSPKRKREHEKNDTCYLTLYDETISPAA
jgi:hypothetical protein